AVLFVEAQAFAQAGPAAPGNDAPAGPAPSAAADAPAEPVAPASSDSGTGVVAHPGRELAPGELSGIPQTDERRYVRSPNMRRMMQRTTTWDLNLELGYGRIFPSPPHWEGFFRGGAGVLFVRDPLFWVLRFTYDYSPRSNATLGTELEANWVETGLWGNIGLMKDANSKYWGGRASVGFALFGFEAEYRGDDTTKTYWALYGKLRIPLGIIGRALP
ncbi:MAG: hypothetical protein ABI461_08300, partial [Polyangiaceae bacterium]